MYYIPKNGWRILIQYNIKLQSSKTDAFMDEISNIGGMLLSFNLNKKNSNDLNRLEIHSLNSLGITFQCSVACFNFIRYFIGTTISSYIQVAGR